MTQAAYVVTQESPGSDGLSVIEVFSEFLVWSTLPRVKAFTFLGLIRNAYSKEATRATLVDIKDKAVMKPLAHTGVCCVRKGPGNKHQGFAKLLFSASSFLSQLRNIR